MPLKARLRNLFHGRRPPSSAASSQGASRSDLTPSPGPADVAHTGAASAESSSGTTDVQETQLAIIQQSNTQQTEAQSTTASLWDKAYDGLKHDKDKHKSDRINKYEALLSRVLDGGGEITTGSMQDQDNDNSTVQNRIDQTDIETRRKKLGEITELGLKHMEDKTIKITVLGHETTLQEQAKNAIAVVEWAEDLIKDAVKDVPYASMVWAGISLVLPLLKNPSKMDEANHEGFTYVTSQMRYYAAMEPLVSEDLKPDLRSDLESRLVDLYKLVIDFQIQSILYFYRSRTKNFFRGTIKHDDWTSMRQDIEKSDAAFVQKFETAVEGTRLAIDSQSLQQLKGLRQDAKTSRDVLERQLVYIADEIRKNRRMQEDRFRTEQDNRCLQHIFLTNPQYDKDRIENLKGGLERDCCSWILDHPTFQSWENDEDSQLLWIKGDAGKGKTMLLVGIIEELHRRTISDATLLSFFFCQATEVNQNTATAVLRGLIYMLGVQNSDLVSHLHADFGHAGSKLVEGPSSFYALSTIFKAMITDPRLSKAILVIDALDECQTDLTLLLDLIVETLAVPSTKFKWIVSSRNQPPIARRLDPATAHMNLSLEVNAELLDEAIGIYIDRKLNKIQNIEGDTKEVRNLMRAKAEGTFLWVALVVKELLILDETEFVEADEVMERLEEVPSGLPELYRQMLKQIGQLEGKDPRYCYTALSMVTLVFRPLHLQELAVLMGLKPRLADKGSMQRIVNKCGSFLTIREDRVRLIHQSAKDFLTEHAQDELYARGQGLVHLEIFSRSIQALSETLRRDIYDIGDPGMPIEDVQTPQTDPLAALGYSTLYWIDHFLQVETQAPGRDAAVSSDGSIFQFLKKHRIHWIEALSLLRKLGDTLISIQELRRRIDSSPHSELLLLIRDLERYAFSYGSIIERVPLQAYAAALIFSPREASLRRDFWQERIMLYDPASGIPNTWDPCLQTLEGHTEPVIRIVFSPDGTRLASASKYIQVAIWNAATGQRLATFQRPAHSGCILDLTFLADNTRLAAVSDLNSIWIWDALTGDCLLSFKGTTKQTSDAIFSPDGTKLATASYSRTPFRIHLWNTETGKLQHTLYGHTQTIRRVAFSPDGTKLASLSRDMTVRIWDVVSGRNQHVFEVPDAPNSCLAFSPDSAKLAFRVDRHTLQIRLIEGGAHSAIINLQDKKPRKIAFSPDGKSLASLTDHSRNGAVSLWDSATGKLRQFLQHNNERVWNIVFSPDGTKLASMSDTTVRIWNTAKGVYHSRLEGHLDSILGIAFSRDSTKLASCSADSTIRLWDVTTEDFQEFDKTPHAVEGMVLSPDRTRIAILTAQAILIWDCRNNKSFTTIKSQRVWRGGAIAFSNNPNSTILIPDGYTIRLWDTTTGELLRSFEGHYHSINSVAFSHDSKWVISGSDDRTVRLWNADTGELLRSFEGHYNSILSVAFSHDSRWVLSGSKDHTARLWDTETGKLLRSFNGHSHIVKSVAFSQDSRWVISDSEDHTARLWDTETENCLKTFWFSYQDYISSVSLTTDTKWLVSLSYNNDTVRLWDTETQKCLKILHTGRDLRCISFDPSVGHLQTQMGTYKLGDPELLKDSQDSQATTEYEELQPYGLGFSSNGEWIMRGDRNLLWLPPQYRSQNACVAGSVIVIGNSTDRLLVIESSELEEKAN